MKALTPEPVTKFCERCDTSEARGKWVGISRLSRVPDAGWPPRSDCQAAVTAEEKTAGVRIVKEYRENEQLAIDHDVSLARARTRSPEVMRSRPSTSARRSARWTRRRSMAHRTSSPSCARKRPS